MNKLKFSEGGQPVYLDDLRTLQDNHFDTWSAVLGALTGGAEAFLLAPCTTETVSTDSTTLARTVRVAAGTLVAAGQLCPFAETTLTVPHGGGVYVCLTGSDADTRVFEDGQSRACIERLEASISATAAGAQAAYALAELPTLPDLLAATLAASGGSEALDVQFANGYSGIIRLKKRQDGDWELSVDVSTANGAWNSEALGYKGFLFTIGDDAVAGALAGKNSPSFTHGGKGYHLSFGNTGTCFLYPDGVDNIYDDSVIIPLMTVNLTFNLSEMTKD